MTTTTQTPDPTNPRPFPPPHADSGGAYKDFDEELFAKGFNGMLLRRILSFAAPYRRQLVTAFMATLLFTAAEVSIPLVIRGVIERAQVVPSDGVGLLVAIGAAVFLGFTLMRFIATFLQENIVGRVGELIVVDLRRAMFLHMQRISLSFMDKTEVGRIMSRLQGDTAALAEFIETSVSAAREFVMLIAIMSVLLFLDWRLGLVTLSVLPVLLIVRIFWLPLARKAFVYSRITSSRVSGTLAENINGVRVVEGMNRQEVNHRLFDEVARENLRSQLRAARFSQMMIPTVDTLTGLAFAGVIVFGGWLASLPSAGITVATMIAFFLYVQRFFDPIRTLTLQYNIFQRAMASGERIFEVMDVPLEIQDKPNSLSPKRIKSSVELKNVTFGYLPNVPVLKNISLKADSGETVALVGPTGSGKTSITALIHRFYEVWEGSVRVGGHDVRDLTQESLGRHVAMVLQEPFLFTGTVLENIRYSSHWATREDIIQAADKVGAHGFIMQLQNGYETVMDQRGGNLSIGQRQLISFARAIVGRCGDIGA